MGPLYSFFGCSPDRHFPDPTDRRPKIENRTNERARKGITARRSLTHTRSQPCQQTTNDGRRRQSHNRVLQNFSSLFFLTTHRNDDFHLRRSRRREKDPLGKTGPLDLRNRPIGRFPPLLAKPMNVSAAK